MYMYKFNSIVCVAMFALAAFFYTATTRAGGNISEDIINDFNAMFPQMNVCMEAIQQDHPYTNEICVSYRAMWEQTHAKYGKILIDHAMSLNGLMEGYYLMLNVYAFYLPYENLPEL